MPHFYYPLKEFTMFGLQIVLHGIVGLIIMGLGFILGKLASSGVATESLEKGTVSESEVRKTYRMFAYPFYLASAGVLCKGAYMAGVHYYQFQWSDLLNTGPVPLVVIGVSLITLITVLRKRSRSTK